MSRSPVSAHPEHAHEQAYIERVHHAAEQSRARAERRPELTGDKYAARTAREQMLERLREPVDLDALCFGRIDLQENGRTHYLGRGVVKDEDNTLLVVNWRVPAVAGFYTASRKDPQGLTRRRRFQLDRLRLLGIVEDTFAKAPAPIAAQTAPPPPKSLAPPERSGPETRIEPEIAMGPRVEPEDVLEPEIEPHMVDAILADMDRARGAQMRDIVATIETRQYELISDDIDGVLVIQGGPGSGKTAVALHRAAWLLYNHREELQRSGVLVVGPNRAFMEYVAQVLPTLGEMSVVQSAVDRLPALGDVRVRGTESPSVAALKGDLRMAPVIQRAVMARVRRPKSDTTIPLGRNRIVLRAPQVAPLIDRAWRSGRTYLAARDAFRRELVALAQQEAGGKGGLFRSGPTPADIEAAVTGSGGPLERIWPTVTAPEVVRDLLNSRQRLAADAASELSSDEQAALQRGRAQLVRDEPWTAADMPLLDEADAAVRGAMSSYGYVLADEAQDLSPMQLRMVFRRSAAGRATLVGDIAQATGPTRFPDWSDLLVAAAVEGESRIAELAIGYRVPRQVMELAAELLPRIAPDIVAPKAVREGPEDPRLLQIDDTSLAATLLSDVAGRLDGDRSVGVIGPSDALDYVRSALIEAGLEPGDILTDGLSRQVTVLSADQAKGLEFDHVVVVEPEAIAGAAEDWAYVYIALTRATRTLSVLYRTVAPFEIAMPEPEPEPVADIAPAEINDVAPLALSSPGTVLGPRYTEALMQAKFLHAGQRRRGTAVPYMAHLQSVAALVLEDGGSEDEAIAALLHDVVEEYEPGVLETIVEQFGT